MPLPAHLDCISVVYVCHGSAHRSLRLAPQVQCTATIFVCTPCSRCCAVPLTSRACEDYEKDLDAVHHEQIDPSKCAARAGAGRAPPHSWPLEVHESTEWVSCSESICVIRSSANPQSRIGLCFACLSPTRSQAWEGPQVLLRPCVDPSAGRRQ